MAGTQVNLGNLEDMALKRRERLKNLKRKRVGTPGESDANPKDCDALPTPMFRSYKPANDELGDFILEPSAPGDVTKEV